MAKRFLPKSVMVANKGGRYDGRTTDPDTGESTNPDGTDFTVSVRHQALFLQHENKDYLMVIFSDLGKEVDLSVMALRTISRVYQPINFKSHLIILSFPK